VRRAFLDERFLAPWTMMPAPEPGSREGLCHRIAVEPTSVGWVVPPSRSRAGGPMDVIDDLARTSLRRETVLTIGAFDGVHRGHQVLIRDVVDRAKATDRLATLLTFHPHPAVVLAPQRAPRYLTTPGEKAALLKHLGIELLVLLTFDRQSRARRHATLCRCSCAICGSGAGWGRFRVEAQPWETYRYCRNWGGTG
jgi:hypothetical protein